MLYRKLPPAPPTLLLRIVATASGVTGVLGAIACGSSFSGSVPLPPSLDASHDAAEPCIGCDAGIILMPDAGDDAPGPCGGYFCGLIARADAGDAADDREPGACGEAGVCGAIVMPDAGVIRMPTDAGEQ
jgi:hypothetical protein